MPPSESISRVEFEARMERVAVALRTELDTIRAEHRLSNEHQDEEWNKGFRSLREDQLRGFESIRADLRMFVTNDVFVARLTPVQAVAYGMVALLMALMTGALASSLWAGRMLAGKP